MSLLQCMPYSYWLELQEKDRKWCIRVAEATNLPNSERFGDGQDPVTSLVNELHTLGFSLEELKKLDRDASVPRTVDPLTTEQIANMVQTCSISPSIKIALLIGNKKYYHWPKLVSPETDCIRLQKILESIGFITVTLLNYKAAEIKKCIKQLFELVPLNAYCFVYYAGHGIEVGGTQKYILGIECPEVDCTTENGVSEHYIIRHVLSCRPELSVIIFDMCRQSLTKETHPKMYADSPISEEYLCENNLLVGYSTSPFMTTFEKKYSSNTDDGQPLSSCEGRSALNLGRNMSLYVEYLSKYLSKKIHINRILDLVHKEFSENDNEIVRQQRPQKLDNMYATYYLTTAARGDLQAEHSIKNYVTNLNYGSGADNLASTRQV